MTHQSVVQSEQNQQQSERNRSGAAICITIPGRLGAWKRTSTHFRQRYTDEKMRVDQSIIRHEAAYAMRGRKLFEGPVQFNVTITRRAPKSWTAKRRAATKYITARPDFDNQAKLIADAFNTVVWRDDAQVAMHMIVRQYGDVDEVVILVSALGDEA